MFEYGFFNIIYANDDYRELEELPKKITKAVSDLKGYPKQKR